ncbi:DNA replication complex GINS protein PSF2 [Cryptosporidium canis]|nr:DNA replication complex GINS protein PSF2 [Cryptosporidium canis]
MSNLSCSVASRGSSRGITFEESLFIAEEKTLVEIIPNISMAKKLIFSIEVGPFVPYQKSKVPLWVAKYLDSKNLCKLIPPDWLTLEGLRKLLLDEDKLGQESLTYIDFYYYQIASVYFHLRNDPFNGKKIKIKSKLNRILTLKCNHYSLLTLFISSPPITTENRAFPRPNQQTTGQTKSKLQASDSPKNAGCLESRTPGAQLRLR